MTISVCLNDFNCSFCKWRFAMSGELTEIQELGLAFGAFYAEVNGLDHDSLLGMDEVEDEYRQSVVEMFDDCWGIKTRDDLVKSLNWLFNEGHRKDYGEDEGDADDIIAWDLCRVINNARFGHMIGLLTETEAWDWITKSAKAMEHKFSSWDAFAENFLRGRSYWNEINEQDDDSDEYDEAIESLLDEDNEDSPWNDIELTDGDGGEAIAAVQNLVQQTFTPEQWAAILNNAAAAAAAADEGESGKKK